MIRIMLIQEEQIQRDRTEEILGKAEDAQILGSAVRHPVKGVSAQPQILLP